MFAGVLADADVFISSSSDPLLNLEYHRHFTHSVLFIPLGALLAALIAWPLTGKRLNFRQIYLFALMGYMLSGFIDACTSYGTHLFWPLWPEAVSFNIISIVDPLFTSLLLITLLIGSIRRSRIAIIVGLSLAALYLSSGWLQKQRAESLGRELAAARGHHPERLLVKPTLGNLVLWRSLYQFEQHIYVDALRLGVFSEPRVYPGASAALFDQQEQYPELAVSSILYNDLQRFLEFSDHYVVIDQQRPGFLVDVRYSMLPNSLESLWGIEIDRQQPEQHAVFRITRRQDKQLRKTFLHMLLGKDID
jgi:inner membrane protein